MDKITFNSKDVQVVRMCRKSLVIKIGNDEFFATKRVANEILGGNTENVFVVINFSTNTKWLATPSVF